MRGFTEYQDFARDVLGLTEYEAYQYAVARVSEDRNRNRLNEQEGRVFVPDWWEEDE